MSVHTQASASSRFPLLEFVRASSLHVGAAAAAAALRRDLVDTGRLAGTAFDEAYTVARVTPGTNLLAMYTLLGERFAGWPGALLALGVGTLVPTIVAVTLGAAYVRTPTVRSPVKPCRVLAPERWPCSPGQWSDSCARSFSNIVVAGLLWHSPRSQ